ncbi:MAG: hypothetical protein JWM91_3048 [Rhodospirillales bacterium]|nr:hypothetical protein [Rhodospirillales bacterium]
MMTAGVHDHRFSASCAIGAGMLLIFGGASGDPLPEAAVAPGARDAVTAPGQASQPPAPTEEQQASPAATSANPSAPPPVPQPGAQTAPEKVSPPDETAKPPENLAAVAPHEATAVLGKKVKGPDGKDVVGAIVDILVDAQGRPRAAIIDFGGFLGVGSRKIAVDWGLLTFRPSDLSTPVVLGLDRSEIQTAPEYKDPTQPAKVVEPPVATPENVENHAN